MSNDGILPQHTAVANVVIGHLALDEAELRDRVVDLEADVVAYRELAQRAIEALADVTGERDGYRRKYQHLLIERRRERRGIDAEAA